MRFPVRRALSLYPAAVALVVAGALGGHYYSEYSSGALGDNPAISLTNFGVEDESSYDLDKDQTVALVQASVIAARHHMAIPSKLDPDILTVRDDEPDVGDCNYEKDSRELCPRGDPDADRVDRGVRQQPRADVDPDLRRDRRGAGLPHLLLREAQLRGHRWSRSASWSPARRCGRSATSSATGRSTRSPPSTRTWSSSPPADPTRCSTTTRATRSRRTASTTPPATGTSTCSPGSPTTAQRTVLLRDVPKSEDLPDECLTEKGNDLGDCLFTPLPASVVDADISERPRPTRPAPRSSTPRSGSAGTARAPSVIGDVLPYRDRGHLTTVYAASLSDELIKAMGLHRRDSP